jgi:putative phosphoesterase
VTPSQREYRVGVISDTHGMLRPEVLDALAGCDRIVHAGDVGEQSILGDLAEVARVEAVRGNVDIEPWAWQLPETLVVDAGGAALYVLHDLALLDLDPAAASIDAVIYGHSHRPDIDRKNGVLYLNPGSAGPRRFHLPVSVAILRVRNGSLDAEIVELTRS